MANDPDKQEADKPIQTLSTEDIRLLKAYGAGPYASKIKQAELDVKETAKRVAELSGIKESDTGLAPPSRWDLVSDKQAMHEEQPLQVRAGSTARRFVLQLGAVLGRVLDKGRCLGAGRALH